MKRLFALCLVFGIFGAQVSAQQLMVRKGVVMDSLPIRDSVASQLKLYLPGDFETNRTWPLLFICDQDGKALQALRYLTGAADKNGYILAATDALHDSIPLANKVIMINSGIQKLREYLPLDAKRVYTAGYDLGGQLAALVPSLIPPVQGVLSIGSNLPGAELINDKGAFDFVGIMGRADYQYLSMGDIEAFLDQKKIPNHVLYHESGHEWPESRYLDLGLQFLSLMAMKEGNAQKDTAYIRSSYQGYQGYVLGLESRGDFLLALDQVEEGIALYDGLVDTDWLKERRREIRRNRAFKSQKREWEQARLQELILVDDYNFYLEEDVATFNLNNLGWWNYQMGKITAFKDSPKREEKLLGQRLEGYLNALIKDYITAFSRAQEPDEDALIFLYMLKTITTPFDYENYLKVISYTAKYGDFGTANFYLEELLKKGYRDAERLYGLPDTGLLRISPEFNKLIEQYLGQARYPTEE